MSKKLILIVGWSLSESSYGVTNTYLEYFSQFGNVRILMPWEDKVDCDLLVLPGGRDILSSNYREVPGYNNSTADVFKEYFFKEKLKLYVESKTSIFGICLGAQQLNVFFGGKLIQDLPFHEQSSSRWSTAHEVYQKLDFKGDVIKASKLNFKVNSHHHQGVCTNSLSEELIPLLYAEHNPLRNEGKVLVEAFEHKELPFSGVQWHPEELYDWYSEELIKKLLNV